MRDEPPAIGSASTVIETQQREALGARVAELEVEVDGLKQALESRSVISAAVGMVMLAMSASENTAFNVLAYMSQNTNTKMKTLAASVCADVAAGRGLPAELADLLHQIDRPPTTTAGSVCRLRVLPDR